MDNLILIPLTRSCMSYVGQIWDNKELFLQLLFQVNQITLNSLSNVVALLVDGCSQLYLITKATRSWKGMEN